MRNLDKIKKEVSMDLSPKKITYKDKKNSLTDSNVMYVPVDELKYYTIKGWYMNKKSKLMWQVNDWGDEVCISRNKQTKVLKKELFVNKWIKK